MKTILVTNQKGGVGKTTLADEIAFGLERRGHKVCFSNLDPQGGVLHVPSLPDDDDDFMVVDTPPMLSPDFSKWCKAADVIIMPTRASMLDMTPLMRCWEKALKSGTKAKMGVVVNFFDPRRLTDKNFVEFLNNASMPIWAKLPQTTAITQAQGLGESVAVFAKKNKATAVLHELCRQLETYL
jgi:chromosome partitioning protein